jgi:ABC-type transport system involved in multi-copper enzyme maturation permease subunit
MKNEKYTKYFLKIKVMPKNKDSFVTYIGYVALLAIIGVGIYVWYTSCNLEVKNGCLSKHIEDGIVIDAYVTSSVDYRTYFYSAFITFNYGGNKTCYHMSTEYMDERDAEKDLANYPIGKEITILVKDKRPSECTDKIGEDRSLWIFGVSLLVIGLTIIICCIISHVYFKDNDNTTTPLLEKNKKKYNSSNSIN